MTDTNTLLRAVPLFAPLADETIEQLVGVATTVEWAAGEELPTETARTLYVVATGEVDIYSMVGGIEKLFMTVQPGGLLGLLSILDSETPPGHSRATRDTTALAIERQALDGIFTADPKAGLQLFDAIGAAISQRVRILAEMYQAALAWNLEVTGLASLNLERLMTDQVRVEVETSRGAPLAGLLIRFESSAAGHELYLESDDRQVHIIPYHAIVRVSVDADLARADDG